MAVNPHRAKIEKKKKKRKKKRKERDTSTPHDADYLSGAFLNILKRTQT